MKYKIKETATVSNTYVQKSKFEPIPRLAYFPKTFTKGDIVDAEIVKSWQGTEYLMSGIYNIKTIAEPLEIIPTNSTNSTSSDGVRQMNPVLLQPLIKPSLGAQMPLGTAIQSAVEDPEKAKKKEMFLYGGIALGVVILGVIIWLATRKK